MANKRRVILATLTSIILLSGFIVTYNCVFRASPAKADGAIGTGGTGSSTNQTNCATQTVGRCHGGGWTWHATSSDSVQIAGSSGSGYNFPGGTITGCGSVGGYWVSSWFRKGDPNDIVGIAKNSQWAPSGPYTYNANAASLSTVYQEFTKAVALGVPGSGTPWADVGWFCASNPNCVEECPEDDPNCVECPKPDPDPRPTPDPASGDGHFWSQSKVAAVAGGDIIAGIEATTDIDGKAEIMFSTDQPSVQIQFQHNLGFNGIPPHSGHNHVTDIYGSAVTDYDITMTQTGGANSTEKTGNFSSPVTGTGSTNQYDSPITVNLQPGETKKVCQTITYHKKNFNIPIVATTPKHGPRVGTPPNDHWAWEEDQHEFGATYLSGSGNSYVCATVTRPAEPSGSGPQSTGTADSTIMFTGEDASISWDTYATSYLTRRLLEWDAITYLVPVNENRWENLTTGTLGEESFLNIGGLRRNIFNPCRWYRGRGNVIACTTSGSGEHENFTHSDTDEMIKTHSYNSQKQVLVPDNVGYKYCNSFGYHYRYYYYSSNSGWHPYNPDYWNVYDATCRTIAKKPSTTIWNGSLMTSGGTKATPAYRYDSANFGETANNQARTLYGSWSEFLAVVGQNTQGVASGSNLSIGSKRGGRDICNNSLAASNSTLTIANTSCGELGYSGIQNNSTYVTRLDTYLKSGASNASHYYNVPNTDDLRNKLSAEGISIDNINKTIVVHTSDDFNITQNIKTNLGPYDSIYQIPQVIIFADGNVNISSTVTEIDAWIITPNGTVNTCSDFAQGVTEADAVGRRYDICTNQLVFNGPVLAKNLNLRRSFGSDPMIGHRVGTFNAPSLKEAAGEIFNLRSDVYLWGYAQAGRYDSSYTESYTRELAPRY